MRLQDIDIQTPINPSRKKPFFPVNDQLRQYLRQQGREIQLPVSYNDLLRFTYSVPLKDKHGNDTLWEKTLYDMRDWEYIRDGLIKIYALLRTKGDLTFAKHLDVARIDYCSFGNSNPFRIRIINKFNDNYDHYYIKQTDASRIYGLELEHILSPNRISFFSHENTLIEDHIPGIPGDIFIKEYLNRPETNKIRLAKEFVKFNERCFVKLLGDMRSYNFVITLIPDIEDVQYRVRAIDFDQHAYEGRKSLYLPQFFKENYPYVEMVLNNLNKDSIEQYQAEERTLMALRLNEKRRRIYDLYTVMENDTISTPEKTNQLKNELASYMNVPSFRECRSMGQLAKAHLKQSLRKSLRLIQQHLITG